MIGTAGRRRVPLVLVLTVCVVGAFAAVSAGTLPANGLSFLQDGHWVAQPATGQVFHIDGAAKTVDARARVPGIERGSQVVQGESSGFVVGDSRITEFGKLSLRVESTVPAPAEERPVAVETAGGPYLVYREAGTVVRLGENPKTISAGDVLGEPVATPDGTLWLHRINTGVLCLLPKDADRISCPAAAPTGHTGALTSVDGEAAFVDTTSDVLRPVSPAGLGEPADLGLDVPREIDVAPADVSGRVAFLDPAARVLHLVDATGVDGGQDVPPITVPLPSGEYTGPTATDDSVVLLDETHDKLLTYTSDGRRHAETAVPKGTPEPRLFRGEDKRVYVDGADGRQVLVVDHDGAVSEVPVIGEEEADDGRVPPPNPPAGDQPERRPERDSAVLANEPSPETRLPEPELQPVPADPPPPPPVPASPPGMPPGLVATPRDGDAVVSWSAAPANGAAVTAYHVSWSSGSGSGGTTSTSGGATSTVLSGLPAGRTYTVSVVAQNRAGRGTPATTQLTMPTRPVVTVTRGRTESHDSECRPPECGLMLFTLKGFEPNTDYTITPYSNAPGYPGDNPEDGATTDAEGFYQDQAFPFSRVGYEVWVVVEGPNGQRFESPRYTWESG